jgi:hypothetical protein
LPGPGALSIRKARPHRRRRLDGASGGVHVAASHANVRALTGNVPRMLAGNRAPSSMRVPGRTMHRRHETIEAQIPAVRLLEMADGIK